MVCKRCGAELKDDDKFCGVCGEPVGKVEVKEEKVEVEQPKPVPTTNTSVESKKDESEVPCLIFGILSLCVCWIGIIFAIISIVMGSKLKKETNKMPAGMICGIISLSIHALLIVVYIAIFVFAAILGVD